MSNETKSRVLIGHDGGALVVHEKPVRRDQARLVIVSKPQHDRYSLELENEIMRRAQERGSDFVRFTDLSAAMQAVNAKHGESDYPCGPRGVLPVVKNRLIDEPREEAWHNRIVEPRFEDTSLQLSYQTNYRDMARYGARAAAYLWQDIQQLAQGQKQEIATNFKNWAALDTKQQAKALEPLNDLAVAAKTRVCQEAGLSGRPGFYALALPPSSAYQQSPQERSRGRGR